MFSYSTGYYVSPPDDQNLKFKNRCSLISSLLNLLNRMPQSLLKGQLKEKPTYRVWCLYSLFVHEILYTFAYFFLLIFFACLQYSAIFNADTWVICSGKISNYMWL